MAYVCVCVYVCTRVFMCCMSMCCVSVCILHADNITQSHPCNSHQVMSSKLELDLVGVGGRKAKSHTESGRRRTVLFNFFSTTCVAVGEKLIKLVITRVRESR